MKKFFTNSGMALVEVLMAAGMVAGISMVVMQLSENSQKSVKSLEINTDVNSTTRQIQSALSKPSDCLATFIDRSAISTLKTDLPLITGISVNGTPSFTTSMTFGSKQLKIVSYELSDADETVDVATWKTTHLIVTYDRGSKALGSQEIVRKIPLKVTVDDNKIESCVAVASGGNAEIWEYAVNNLDIYYPAEVGIGDFNPKTEPKTALHVKEGSLLVEGTADVTATNIPTTGAGSKMWFWPERSAFRVGLVTGTQWDLANIGEYSVAIGGMDNKASGLASLALGPEQNIASGDVSVAIGSLSNATADNAIAIGNNTLASGLVSMALGYQASALGAYSTAIGYGTTARGQGSVAVGTWNTLTGTVNGTGSTDPQFVVGNGTVSTRSDALTIFKSGNAQIQGSLEINTTGTTWNNKGITVNNGSIMVRGEGTGGTNFFGNVYDGSHSDYFRIYMSGFPESGVLHISTGDNNAEPIYFEQRNTSHVPTVRMAISTLGRVGIGANHTAPAYPLEVLGDINASGGVVRAAGTQLTSDKRLKKDITPITDSLDKILKLNGYSFYWKDKKKFNDKKQLGLIAQEVKKEFPDSVSKEESGYLSVSYTHLIAPVIEAIKELYFKLTGINEIQQAHQLKIEKLEAENKAIKSYLCNKDPAAKLCR